MISSVSTDESGHEYIRRYLEQFGDVCSRIVLNQIVKLNGKVSVVGPPGVDEALLRELAFGGGGFGVTDEVPKYLESRILEYLTHGSDRIAVFELLMGTESVDTETLPFPAFVFSPSLYGTSDGNAWTYWNHGICGYQTSSHVNIEALKEALVESNWSKGIVFLLPLKDSNRRLLDEGTLWDEGLLIGLFEKIEVIFVPAHNREALVVWQSLEKHDCVQSCGGR